MSISVGILVAVALFAGLLKSFSVIFLNQGSSYITTYVSISVGILVAVALFAGLLKYYLFLKKSRKYHAIPG